jgi:hypothetical protein
VIPAWLAHERSGSGLVGPGSGWDPTWAAELADGEPAGVAAPREVAA